MRRTLIVATAAVLFAVESRAAEVDVTTPESVVRRAPFDEAPEVGRRRTEFIAPKPARNLG